MLEHPIGWLGGEIWATIISKTPIGWFKNKGNTYV